MGNYISSGQVTDIADAQPTGDPKPQPDIGIDMLVSRILPMENSPVENLPVENSPVENPLVENPLIPSQDHIAADNSISANPVGAAPIHASSEQHGHRAIDVIPCNNTMRSKSWRRRQRRKLVNRREAVNKNYGL